MVDSHVTTSYFDSRPNARFFAAIVDDIVVSIRQNLPTYDVTNGEVWAAWRNDGRLFEHRFADVADARRQLGRIVRGHNDLPLIVAWTSIPRAEYAVSCPICAAAFGQPCVEGREPLLASKGHARIIGAPWRLELHDVEVNFLPGIHVERARCHHQLLHGDPPSHAPQCHHQCYPTDGW